MIDLETILYVFVSGVLFTLSVVGLESAISTPSLSSWNRRLFSALFISLVLASASFFLELVGYLYPSLTLLRAVAYLLQSLLFAALFPMMTIYLLHCCDEEWQSSPLFRIMLVLASICAIMLGISLFVPSFYQIVPGGELALGPAYPLLVTPVLAMLLLIAAAVLRRKSKLPPRHYRAFLTCLVPVTVAMIIHMLRPSFLLVDVGLTVTVFSIYRFAVLDSIEQDRRQQQEIASQRARIAVLQMRPHFLYNTMTSIYHLCDEDPELAKQVTMDFSTYLRRIFTAIASEDVIPFSEELEHTRAYLSVEQAQFEDDLCVDYDTPHTRFRLPPLTLQPIVENAVKHGMDLDAGPLHIWIKTRETELGSEVTVEDDGVGFDPAVADDPSTTLANIRQRLCMMCKGTLEIARRAKGGSIVTVTIPR